MVFSSMVFLWLFLPIIFVLYRLVGRRLQNALLLIASLLFYAWGEPVYVILMLVSVTINYYTGLLIHHFQERRSVKKGILATGIVLNLALLGYFKYYNFAFATLDKLFGQPVLPEKNIILPIGISFFTFQAMSYVIDLYRGEYKVQKNILNLALYISFFPQLIAGPIVKYKDIDDQINIRTISMEKTVQGIRRFIYGLAKKVIIANTVGEIVDKIYGLQLADVNSSFAWIAALFYALQVYYDFSGYSDMAIGLGKMFGFEFLENFNYPYISSSIQEFWRRWHISLSTWFKEYVYIPLGGNRKGKARTYLNLFLVFFATGLWHGASWAFVLWGIYHGLFQIMERSHWFQSLSAFLKKHKFGFLLHIYTMVAVLFGWVLFRIAGTVASLEYIKRMLMPWVYQVSRFSFFEIVTHRSVAIALCGLLGCGLVQTCIRKRFPSIDKYRYGIMEMLYCMLLLIYCTLQLVSNTYNPFIYFRF